MVRLVRGVLDDPCLSETVTGSLRRRQPLDMARLANEIDGQCFNECTGSGPQIDQSRDATVLVHNIVTTFSAY